MSLTTVFQSVVENLNSLFYRETAVNLLLLNDDYVFEGLVRQALSNTFGYDSQKATQLMYTAHTYGSAVIWTGDKPQAEEYALILRTHYGLTTEVIDV